MNSLLERLHADAPVGVEEALSLLPQRLVDVGRFLDGIDNAVFIEAGPNDLGQACVFRSCSAEEELIIFGSFAVHAQNADVSGMMMTAGVDAAGNLELQLTHIPLTLGVGETLADLLRHRNRPRIDRKSTRLNSSN